MTFQFRKAEPWESQELVWWADFKSVCAYRDCLDDRICDHAANKFAQCSPDSCQLFKKVIDNPELADQVTTPPPLPAKPDYYRVQSNVIMCGTLPTTTWDECPGDKTKEDILDELIPQQGEGCQLMKMVIREERRKCR